MKRAQHVERRAPHVPFIVLVTALIVGGMALLLLLNTASAANEVRRHDLALRDDAIAAQVQQLQNEVAASAAPGNLAQAAAELGMVPAGDPAFLVIGRNGAVRVLGSPAAVSAEPVAAPNTVQPKPKPKPSTSKSPTDAAKSSTAAHGATASVTPAKTSATPTPTPKPTPTPTPTLTLPGGNR